jgi:hypothetical protein
MRGARYVRLIPWTLHSGSEQFIYNWKLEKGPGPGSKKLEAAQRNGQEETGTEIQYPRKKLRHHLNFGGFLHFCSSVRF